MERIIIANMTMHVLNRHLRYLIRVSQINLAFRREEFTRSHEATYFSPSWPDEAIWTFTGLQHAWHLRLRRPPQQALRPLKHCHMGAQLSRAILEFILSVADRRATWLQVAERSLL